MMPTKVKLAAFLIPSLAAILFLAWWRSPTQVVLRRVDSLIELVDVPPLRLSASDEIPVQLEILVAPELTIGGTNTIPTGSFTQDQLTGFLTRLHGSVAACRLVRGETTIDLTAPPVARVTMPLEVQLSWGHGAGRTVHYRTELRFTMATSGWLLDQIHLVERP